MFLVLVVFEARQHFLAIAFGLESGQLFIVVQDRIEDAGAAQLPGCDAILAAK